MGSTAVGAPRRTTPRAGVSSRPPETAPERAYDLVLRIGGTVILASTAPSLLVRRRLSTRGEQGPGGL